MKQTYKKYLTTLSLLLVLGLSAMTNVTVYADEATPETPTSVEGVEVSEPASPAEEAPQPELQPASEPETSASTESAAEILASVPDDVAVVVVDEAGEILPLASESAAEAIVVGDPIWCPATVAVPTANMNGCSGSYTTFALLLADPIFAGGGPASDGVIWVASNYNGADSSAITINGGSLTTMNDFKLTIKGGWCDGTDITCVGLVDITKPSTFDVPLIITGWANDVTISDIKVQNGMVVDSFGVNVVTTGNITINRVSVLDNNNTSGAFLNNTSGVGNVTVTDSVFNNNNQSSGGLEVISNGTITLKNVTANDNGAASSGPGINLNNTTAATPKAITITNITVNNNENSGLVAFSDGIITVTDITAINNGITAIGVVLNNLTGTAGVTLNGTNLFYDNASMGLQIATNGTVKASNLHAINNGFYGVSIVNSGAATPQSVTLTGSSVFKFNNDDGLTILSLGAVTLNNITSSFNNGYGVIIDNNNVGASGDVKLTGSNNFIDNTDTGLQIDSSGMILLNNITATSNGNFGARLDNTASSLFKAVTLTGTNIFDGNASIGLQINSDGVVTTNNITSINNSSYGVLIDNDYSTATTPKAVLVNGTNNISSNSNTGLFVESHGAITISNLTANFNGQGGSGYGAELRNNSGTLTPAPVTLNGNNTFNGNRDLGLYVLSLGTIKTNNLIAKDTINGGGVTLQNSNVGAVGDVLMLGVNQFTGNDGTNLSIYSNGNVTVSNIVATGSVNGYGVIIDNASTASTPKNVTISGTNFLNNNFGSALTIYSMGVITLNNITANSNIGGGTYLDNYTYALTAKDIKLTGTNIFNNNGGSGLYINSLGNIVVNNLTATYNTVAGSYGAFLNNDYTGGVGNVTLTGTNKLIDNDQTNLHIESYGVVTINNLTASQSDTGSGAYIINTNPSSASKAVSLTGVNNFNDNEENGLAIFSHGIITTSNITATNNGVVSGHGVLLDNTASITLAGITMNGTNVITYNKNTNLEVTSLGNIKINNLNASNSVSGGGAFISNDYAGGTGSITLTGTNQFNSNMSGVGLVIYSKGAISINNVTAGSNNSNGVHLYNLGSTELVTNKPITITGYIVTVYNGSDGLEINTYSNIVINNLTSTNNTFTGARLDQDHPSSITPVNVTINGTNNVSNNSSDGLVIETLGTVTLNNINASTNTGVGLGIDANSSTAIGTITLKGTNTFNDNVVGLLIDSNRTVTLNSITANNNSNNGVDIENNTSTIASPVTLTGTNTFNNNTGVGLYIVSKGAITVNAITAKNNATGAALSNGASPTSASVTLTGTSTFISNGTGLLIQTSGNITTNNITANENLSHGVSINNTFDATASSITMKGINNFSYNGGDGLLILSNGAVTLTKFTADGNASNGVTINIISAPGGNVSLTCGSTTNNSGTGLTINMNTPFTATITGLVSLGNAGGAANLTGTGTYIQLRGCPLP